MLDKIRITISKTATGVGYYIQIMSKDQTSLNVVVITKELEIDDKRNK